MVFHVCFTVDAHYMKISGFAMECGRRENATDTQTHAHTHTCDTDTRTNTQDRHAHTYTSQIGTEKRTLAAGVRATGKV